MRAYSTSDEEAVRARGLLKDWLGEGFLAQTQYERMEAETVCALKRTNIFLRLVLFFFTLIIVGAGAALFFVVMLSSPTSETSTVFLLIFAVISYGAAEAAVSQARLYRYGIEEALAVCAVGFLCAGMLAALSRPTEFLVPAAAGIASVWIWHRFGLSYAFLAAMIFVIWLAGEWTSSHPAQHMIVAAFYLGGLITVSVMRSGYRFTYLDEGYSIVEALLWLGIYLAMNLHLSSLTLLWQWWGVPPTANEFPRTFYWATWVLTWCLPPAVLVRGVRLKDRCVMAVGGITAILTLVTNKPYLGWARHSWDPMLLGALLIGVALLLRRWLAAGPGGIRQGFTAQRLSGKDKHWMTVGSTVFGMASAHAIGPSPQAASPEAHFGGGESGGGGATSDF